jgi:uncharacterized membrane-anchored protein
MQLTYISTFNATFFALMACTFFMYTMGFVGALIAQYKGKLDEYTAFMSKRSVQASSMVLWLAILIYAGFVSLAGLMTYFAVAAIAGGIIGGCVAYQKQKAINAATFIDPDRLTIALQEAVRRGWKN